MTTNTKQKTAVGYIRTSTKTQLLSPAVQLKDIQDWCRNENVKLISYYEDLNVSGAKNLIKRKGFQKAINDIVNYKADYLIAQGRDRYARDILIMHEIEELVSSINAKVKSTDIDIDLSIADTPTAKHLKRTLDIIEEYNENVRKREIEKDKKISDSLPKDHSCALCALSAKYTVADG